MPTLEEVAKQSLEARFSRMSRTADDLAAAIRVRFQVMLSNDDPKIYADPSAADRLAEDRQYLRNDAGQALGAFRKRREESSALLRTLTPDQLQRGCLHPTRGRVTIDAFVTMLTWHDDNHLDQLRRALAGKA